MNKVWYLCSMLMIGSTPTAFADELAQRVHDILKDRCFHCHGQNTSQEMKDVLDYDDLIKDRGEETFLIPGDLKKSYLWRKISGKPPSMPEDLEGGLPAGELEQIRNWILGGAAKWELPPVREYISEKSILTSILDDLRKVRDKETRGFVRYFSLTHVYNSPEVSERALQLYRAALSKSLNSLSRSSSVFVPTPVNPEATVFRVNLLDYGWSDLRLWSAVRRIYPYGLQPKPDSEDEDLFAEIREAYGEGRGDLFPYVRADWFVVNALNADKHELYDAFLQIPKTLDELYASKGINAEEDFRFNRSKRAGLLQSAVSAQNRVIELHLDGKFWISYDFKKNTERQFLPLFPLGPKFTSGKFSQFEDVAFEQDGGEIIFELKNGLHGFMLVDGKGNRISQGPVDVVFDEKKISGSPLIVNGLSCIACHTQGLKNLADDIRTGHSVGSNSEAASKIKELYLDQTAMQRTIEEANESYLAALRRCIGDYFSDQEEMLETEPVGFVAKAYEQPVTLLVAARELGISDDSQLKSMLGTQDLRDLGLTPLEKGGTIKRDQWESRGTGVSIFQNAAQKMNLGIPAR